MTWKRREVCDGSVRCKRWRGSGRGCLMENDLKKLLQHTNEAFSINHESGGSICKR